MRRRNWKAYQPASLQEAIKACTDFALERHNRGVERIADLMGVSTWTLYKWISNGNLPARLIRPFEHACGCHFVTAWIAASAHRLLIEFPTGRVPNPDQVHDVQMACNAAVGALLAFAREQADAPETLAALRTAMECLAHEHANVAQYAQPELPL
jgi:hypothetical protein